MAGGGHIRVNQLKPRAPILCNTEHAQSLSIASYPGHPMFSTLHVVSEVEWWHGVITLSFSLYPESQSTTTITPKKNNSANLACMEGYWDPEFKPCIKEIMNYRRSIMVILSLRFLWRVCTLRWPCSVYILYSTWQVEVTSGSTGSSRAPQYTRIRSMRSLSMCPSSNYGGYSSEV